MKCLVIYTPHAMKGRVRKNKEKIKTALQTKFEVVEFLKSEYKGHTSVIASSACGVYDCLIALGGDGTFNEVINGIAQKEVKPMVGFLPCGTVNDMARSLGISKRLDKALKVILDGKTFMHDVFKVNDRYGIYVVAAGILTNSSYSTKQDHKRRFGWSAYALNGVKELFKKNNLAMRITCDDGQVFYDNYALMILANSNSVAGFSINRGADLNDGIIDIILVKQSKFIGLTNIISTLRLGKLFLFKIRNTKTRGRIIHAQAKSLKIENFSRAKLNIDGEYGGDAEEIEFKMLRQEVEIFVPDKNPSTKGHLVKKI